MGYLRVLLALSVLIFHAGNLYGYVGMDGLMAVHVFFIISGFYMSLILIEKYSKSKRPYYTFITNRFLRIYPIYWVILILMIYVDFSQIHSLQIKEIFSSIPHAATHYFNVKKLTGIIADITLLVRPDYFNHTELNSL